jgi:DNA mismatch repair ATPase MutS
MPEMIYKSNIELYAAQFKKTEKLYNLVSFIRLLLVLVFLISLYLFTKNQDSISFISGISSIFVFIFLINFHNRIGNKKNLLNALLNVNKNESDFLERKHIAFEDGREFSPDNHPYAYDIDILGPNSLFQNLNRCGTYPGKAKLAESLLNPLSADEIKQQQEAVAELAPMFDFRQKMLALSEMQKDSKSLYDKLLEWTKLKNPSFSVILRILSFALPALFWALLVYYIFSKNSFIPNALTYVFLINLAIIYSQLKKIQYQLVQADYVKKVLRQYAQVLAEIEKSTFKSKKLIELQGRIKDEKFSSGKELAKLASIFDSLEAIQNLLGAVIFNGLFLYHLHVFHALLQWKKVNAQKLKEWLNVIAEFETLNSFANLSYNNPGFSFPEINANRQYSFESLGHPLLDPAKRIDNDVDFSEKPFIVLTGSNMSGKSTFLRSIAVNLVLSSAGSVICAKKATVHPIPLFVSMRLSDSLADSESYFYAEIKRLHEIMQQLENGQAFVLLDEILRGTNSDDKRNGTIGVLKKLIDYNAIGAIATHDLEVCNTADEYPDYLSNQCFEVEIKQENLYFDYKLRQGISQNKSASFLMKKMKIIS